MASYVQGNTYSADATVGVPGGLADQGPNDIVSASASASTNAGQLVIRSTADRVCRPLVTGDTPAADADAIATVIATATTAVNAVTTALDGAVGQTAFWPPRNVTLTLNSHADWDPSTIVVEGLGANGEPVSEAFEVPNGGNVTLTGTVAFSQVTAVKIPPQTGASGTLDVGLGVKIGPINRKVYGIAQHDTTRETGPYEVYEEVPIVRKGRVLVTAETAVTRGDPVYVRFVVSGDEAYGGLSNAPDSTDCGLLEGARWGSTTTTTGQIAVLEINLP